MKEPFPTFSGEGEIVCPVLRLYTFHLDWMSSASTVGNHMAEKMRWLSRNYSSSNKKSSSKAQKIVEFKAVGAHNVEPVRSLSMGFLFSLLLLQYLSWQNRGAQQLIKDKVSDIRTCWTPISCSSPCLPFRYCTWVADKWHHGWRTSTRPNFSVNRTKKDSWTWWCCC